MRIVHRLLAAPFALLVLIAACSHTPPNTTPQAAVAHYGTDVVMVVNQIQGAVIAATDANPPVWQPAAAVPTMDALRHALNDAQQLSTALKNYDKATGDKSSLAQRIDGLLQTISASVQIATSGMPSQVAQQTTQLVANLATTVANVRSALALRGQTP